MKRLEKREMFGIFTCNFLILSIFEIISQYYRTATCIICQFNEHRLAVFLVRVRVQNKYADKGDLSFLSNPGFSRSRFLEFTF